MKKCNYCGAQIEDGNLFCTECGKPVSQGRVCPHCGVGISDDDVFCSNCGKNISDKPVLSSTEPPHNTGLSSNDTCHSKNGTKLTPRNNSKRIHFIVLALVFVLIGAALYGYKNYYETKYNDEEFVSLTELAVKKEIDNDKVEDTSLSDTKIINEWYSIVLDVMGGAPSDKDMDKYLSPNLKERIWTEDYEGVYEYNLFRTAAQDSSPNGDECKIESITSDGDGWYIVKYLDQGWEGLTKVKVKDGKIVDFVEDKSWKSWDN